jgi:hypothetical protein
MLYKVKEKMVDAFKRNTYVKKQNLVKTEALSPQPKGPPSVLCMECSGYQVD